MKNNKKSLTKWQKTEQLPQKQSNISLNSYRLYDKNDSSAYIFSLPQPVLEEPKHIITKRAKHFMTKEHFQNSELVEEERYYNRNIRNTLINKAKQVFFPFKKQYSVMEANKRSLEKQLETIPQKKVSIIKQNSSKKTLEILQKIIVQDVDFYSRQKSVFELQANKLPIIECKQSKRKQILASYEARFNPPHSSISKYQNITTKVVKPITKRQKPYFSGWQIQHQI